MSRLGAKTYSRKPDCRTSVQFDHLLSDKGNKPSTAKVSVAGIHRWGMTSFTSLRKTRINGQKEVKESLEPVKRVKLDTSTSISMSDDPFSFETDIENPSKNSSSAAAPEKKPVVPKPNKFFKSGSRLAAASNSPKNSDFDALLQSVKPTTSPKPVPPNFKASTDPQDVFLNVHTSFSDEVTHSSIEQPVFMTSSSPNIVDLRYSNAPNSCASTNYSNTNPSVHYISPYIQPLLSTDASSKAFDALRTIDLTDKSSFQDSCLQFESVTNASDSFVKQERTQILAQEDKSVRNSNVNNMQHISQNLNNASIQKICDFNEHYLSPSYASEKSNLDQHNLKEHGSNIKLDNANSQEDYGSFQENYGSSMGNFSTSQENFETSLENFGTSEETFGSSQETFGSSQENFGSSQETAYSQSTDKSDESNATKTSSRPKKIFSSSLKFKAKYNHRHWHSSKKELEESEVKATSLADEFEDEIGKETFNDVLIEDIANTSTGELRSVKCPKDSKQYYTVVKNVKQAYQCHESGETQEFNDDIEYLLECVQDCNCIGTRCLSVLNLAAKCMGPAFRIHLRAHGTMPKIFSALKDAPTDPNLALCTATLMFVLSQDRLTMDIEASTLSLMLQLLETDPELRNPEKEIDLILKDPALCAMQEKHTEKVYQLCEEMQQKGHAKHLKLDNINTGILAMETLLSLTSRKAGEWFKEEMRTLHGLDHIADTVTSCVELLVPEEREIVIDPTEVQLDRIRKIDRCLRVLENVTHMNSENQEYLMNYKNLSLISTCLSLMQLCKSHLLEQKPVSDVSEEPSLKSNKSESPVLSCLLNLLKILSNITYSISLNDSRFPPEDGFMDNLLTCILQAPRAVPVEKRFDLLVLSLGLMINLVEYCDDNSTKLIEMNAIGSFDTVNDGYEMPASETLVELMLARLEAARLSEEQADELLNSQEEKQAISIEKKEIEAAVEDLEETLMKTLQKAGKHMEHSIIAAYIAILLGCVAQKSPGFIDILREYVPDGKFDVMVEVLKKFKSFVTLTGSVRSRELIFIQRVIQVLESS